MERLGVGGMATVHRAVERSAHGLERVVAIKRLLPELAGDPDIVRSFIREAKLAALLQHPNICRIFRLGRAGARYFIAMEYIEGRDMRTILARCHAASAPPPIGVVLSLLQELCDGVHYAHRCTDPNGMPLGLVHRDLSPSNLILSSCGRLKIIDFGVAKATRISQETQVGLLKGKFAYMSPEHLDGQRLDCRADVFSIGVIAHELLTARPLFESSNEYQTIRRIQSAEVLPPSTYNAAAPPELDDIVFRALERDREVRWQSAGAMGDAIAAVRTKYHDHTIPRDVAQWTRVAANRPITRSERQHRPLTVDLDDEFDAEVTFRGPGGAVDSG
jgi:serine/threonine protein kinase